MWEQPDLQALVFPGDAIPQNSNRMELSNSQQARCRESLAFKRPGSSPALCSMIGAVAKGTDFKSKGFSEGSRVYWCRALSRPGMDTVNPGDRRDRSLKPQQCQVFSLTLVKPGKRHRLVLRLSYSTIQDVASIEGLLLLLQNIQVEGGSVSHFVVIIHHTPERKVENFLQNPHD